MMRDRAVQVRHRLDVHGNHVGAGGDELVDIPIRLFDHQVHVERPGRDALDRADDRRANGDVRHEVAVHHVDMDQVGAAPFDRGDVAPEVREVCREDRRRDCRIGALIG